MRVPNPIPHQSILGNSSNIYEIPSEAAASMAGPTPSGETPLSQADYKDTAALKSCHSEFHHKFLWCGFLKADDQVLTRSSAFSFISSIFLVILSNWQDDIPAIEIAIIPKY